MLMHGFFIGSAIEQLRPVYSELSSIEAAFRHTVLLDKVLNSDKEFSSWKRHYMSKGVGLPLPGQL